MTLSFREELNLNFHQPLPARLLAEHLKVLLLSQNDVPKLPSSDLSVLNNSNNWSGVSFLCGEQPVILYNSNHSPARNESTIMHELSHIILKHVPEIDEKVKHLGLYMRKYDLTHEKEAEWLGGCLQIPFDGMVSALLKNKTIEQIASQYLASIEMAKFRINKSGAMQKANFIKKRKVF